MMAPAVQMRYCSPEKPALYCASHIERSSLLTEGLTGAQGGAVSVTLSVYSGSGASLERYGWRWLL